MTGITVTNPGHRLRERLGLHHVPGLHGSGATAEAVVQTTGVVTGITVDAGFEGSGYSAPTVTINGGGATTDATAHALGGVDAVSVVAGSGYRFPTVEFALPDDPNGVQAEGRAIPARLRTPTAS